MPPDEELKYLEEIVCLASAYQIFRGNDWEPLQDFKDNFMDFYDSSPKKNLSFNRQYLLEIIDSFDKPDPINAEWVRMDLKAEIQAGYDLSRLSLN